MSVAENGDHVRRYLSNIAGYNQRHKGTLRSTTLVWCKLGRNIASLIFNVTTWEGLFIPSAIITMAPSSENLPRHPGSNSSLKLPVIIFRVENSSNHNHIRKQTHDNRVSYGFLPSRVWAHGSDRCTVIQYDD